MCRVIENTCVSMREFCECDRKKYKLDNLEFSFDSRYPLSLDGIRRDDPTMRPRWTEWSSDGEEVLEGSSGNIVFVRKVPEMSKSERRCQFEYDLDIWDLSEGHRIIRKVNVLLCLCPRFDLLFCFRSE